MESGPSFEDALEQLERIVEALEAGTTELADALAQYERGVRLLSHCYSLLDGAEQTVALLAGVDDAGNPWTTPFDATATAARESPPDNPPPPTPEGRDRDPIPS